MPYSTPSLDDNAIFGQAVKIQVVMKPSVNHLAEFFGINGVFATFGGKRGRHILVEGCLTAPDIPSLNLAEGTFETYIDGQTHVLIDTRGREWDSVIFEGDFRPDEMGPRPLIGVYDGFGNQYWALPYKAAFLSLT